MVEPEGHYRRSTEPAAPLREVRLVDAVAVARAAGVDLDLERLTLADWLGVLNGAEVPWTYAAVKRCLDVLLAAAVLLLGLPALAVVVVVVAIKLDSPGPAFYRHQRVCRGLRLFHALKFRTMLADAAPEPIAIFDPQTGGYRRPRPAEDMRLTRVGRWLRRYSLDELPQVVNVLRGEMSFIGPRPLSVPESLAIPRSALVRFAVPSGLSGLAQIRSRGQIVSVSRFAPDVEYVANFGPVQDWAIFLKTFAKLYDPGSG